MMLMSTKVEREEGDPNELKTFSWNVQALEASNTGVGLWRRGEEIQLVQWK